MLVRHFLCDSFCLNQKYFDLSFIDFIKFPGTDETDKTEEQKNDDKNEVEMSAHVTHPSNLVNDLTTAASTFEEKQKQLMLADCQRLKKKMNVIKNSIQRPPLLAV